jgi:hypothetical protein
MRRFLIVLALCAASTWFVGAQQPQIASTTPATFPAKIAQAAPFTLTVDNIMRGQKLIGSAPTAIRWAPDSSKIYFSWQKPNEDRAATYSVNRDGSELKPLTPEEVRQIPSTPTGRLDRAHRRLLAAEGGNIVVYDLGTNARRLLMKTAAMESNPRWARKDTAVTFMRDGNLFLMTLEAPGTSPTEVQLTDVPAVGGDAAPGGARGGMGGAATGQRGGGQGGGAQAQSGQAARGTDRPLPAGGAAVGH